MQVAKHTGISNGVEYPVFKIDENNNKIGLTLLKEWAFKVWVTFDKIYKDGNNK